MGFPKFHWLDLQELYLKLKIARECQVVSGSSKPVGAWDYTDMHASTDAPIPGVATNSINSAEFEYEIFGVKPPLNPSLSNKVLKCKTKCVIVLYLTEVNLH